VDYICDTAIILADEDYRIVAILAIAGLSAFAHKTRRDGEKTAPMETTAISGISNNAIFGTPSVISRYTGWCHE
jgi:hypothetical protein